MTTCFNCLLYQRFLFTKVRLLLENAFVAANIGIRLASSFTFALELLLPQTTFHKDSLDTFWHVKVIWMVVGINHWLQNLAITNVPLITHGSLFTPRLDIHAQNQQGIFTTCGVALGIVNEKQCLITSTMDHLKSWNDFFLELHANDNAIRFKHCF
jgi:hypothetical protein